MCVSVFESACVCLYVEFLLDGGRQEGIGLGEACVCVCVCVCVF